MSFDRLRTILAEVGGQTPTATEVAEALWLATYVGPHSRSSAVADDEPRDRPGGLDGPRNTGERAEPGDLSELQQLQATVSPEPAVDASDHTGFDLNIESTLEGFETAPGSFQPLTVPSATTLNDRLELQRALRPLKRRVPSRHHLALDETETAERIADEMLRAPGAGPVPSRRTRPCFRPAEERWLRLDFVFDASPSMAIWREHAAELERLVNQLGAFSAVQCWSLDVLAGTATIRPFGVQTGGRRPSAIYGVAGRQAILVMSDCSGAAWWQGTAGRVLAEWGRRAPVAVVQPLPERLWGRTAAPASPGTMRVSRPGQPNSRMGFTPNADFPPPAEGGLPVPVVELAAPWFAGWASTVAGISSARFPVSATYLGGVVEASESGGEGTDLTPEQRVLRFRSSASPEAFRLAGYVATTVPTVPVMRLVQRAMFGRSVPAELAEVVLSGLFRTDYSGLAAFTFIEGVREVMLSTLTKSDSLSAVHVLQGVSRLIESRIGDGGQGFQALLSLPQPAGAGEGRAGPSFALVSPEALVRLAPQALRRTSEKRTQANAATPAREVGRPDEVLQDLLRTTRTRPRASQPKLRISQPMLFVGLGGTGCKVGAELEKRLREELCGPDGTGLQDGRNFLPYQLPSFLQFVYADLSTSELQRVRREVIPGREHDQAAQKTMRLITDLVPAGLGNSADVAQSLRINLGEDTVGWLPPKESDPRIGPLIRGAGQLPTVGRAVLFETIRRSPDAALDGIREALAAINAANLYNVDEKLTSPAERIIIFVAFSVAGGTGSGIYYDYLHLIGNLMLQGGKQAEIYPLVLMPSAFDDAQGGGRPADLNAGSALIELFRLIDDQNAQGSPDQLDASGAQGAVTVRYPRLEQVHLQPNMIQTAFLFGRPVGGVRRDDLHRSMASLMISLIGAGPSDQQDEDQVNRPYQSFADGFINSAVERYATAETGVGRRGVTTSAVAALTTPLLEITDILSTHLLANAVTELLVPPGAAETNKPYIRNFIAAAGLDRLLDGTPMRIPPQHSPVGYGPVAAELTERANAMAANIERGQDALAGPIATLAQAFEPVAASEVLLRELDLFRLQRAVFGHPDLADPLDRGGFQSLLEGWQSPPVPPAGLNSAAPPMPDNLPRRVMPRLRMADPPVQAVIRKQDSWYGWQTRRLYNAAWKDSRRLWARPWQTYVDELRTIHEQFLNHVRSDRQQFDVRSKDLYKPRVGVAYLLPPEDRGLEGFYQTVLTRLKQEHAQHLPPNPHEGHVLNLILGPSGWATAYKVGRLDPEAAIGYLRQRIKEAVTEQVRPGDRTRPALIPRMEDLLSSAALRRDKNVADGDLNRFRQKLAELVPGGFAPDGHAPLKALFTYPAGKQDANIERFLRHEVPLPVDMLGEPEFRAVQADSMVVVLTRSSMGVTEVPELRRVIKLWAEAQHQPRAHDYLDWRRWLGQDAGYLLMDAEDRQHVLHALLCAAWDGKVIVAGDPASPDYITVEVGGREATPMQLHLASLGTLSSWASVLQEYERWILTDDSPTRRGLAARLMAYRPRDADRSPAPPAAVFQTLVDLIEQERGKIAAAEQNSVLDRDPQLVVFREFWLRTMPAALGQRVGVTPKSLLDLNDRFRG